MSNSQKEPYKSNFDLYLVKFLQRIQILDFFKLWGGGWQEMESEGWRAGWGGGEGGGEQKCKITNI